MKAGAWMEAQTGPFMQWSCSQRVVSQQQQAGTEKRRRHLIYPLPSVEAMKR